MCSRVPFCCFHSLRQVSVDEDLCADPEKGHVSSSEVLQDRHSAFSALHVFFLHLGTKGTRSSSYWSESEAIELPFFPLSLSILTFGAVYRTFWSLNARHSAEFLWEASPSCSQSFGRRQWRLAFLMMPPTSELKGQAVKCNGQRGTNHLTVPRLALTAHNFPEGLAVGALHPSEPLSEFRDSSCWKNNEEYHNIH